MHVKALFRIILFSCIPAAGLAQTPAAEPGGPSNETAAQASPAVAPAAEAAVSPPPAAPPPPTEVASGTEEATMKAEAAKEAEQKDEALGKAVAVGKEGFFQPGGLIQAWFFLNHQENTSSTFRLRRAELTARGEIAPKLLAYRITVDAAKLLRLGSETVAVTDEDGEEVVPAAQVEVPTAPADGSILQDVFITWMSDYVDASVGQFKIPVSWEGYNSSSKVLFPERSLVSRQFGDRRDIGLRLEKKLKHFGYTAGLYNGQGQNHLDENNQKDIALRLEGYPIKGVMIGAVGYTSVGGRSEAGKDRIEGDVRAELGNALLQGEYIHGWDGPRGSRVEGHGFYAAFGYLFFDHLQPVARVGFLDTNNDVDDNETTHYELGANYYVIDHDLKFQTSLGFFDPSASGAKTLTELTVAAQVSF